MRFPSVLLLSVLFGGCAGTSVIERPLDTSAIPEINALCVDGCAAEVSFHGMDVSLDASQDTDSLYGKLKGKDVAIQLKDSTVLRGRVSRLVGTPDQWLMGQLSRSGGLTDTVRFHSSSIDRAWVSQTSRTVTTGSLRLRGEDLYVGSDSAVPLTAVRRIQVSEPSGRDRGRGFLVGVLPGAIAGGVFLGAFSQGLSGCRAVKFGGPRSCHTEAFMDGFVVGAPLGGLLTGLPIGKAVVKREGERIAILAFGSMVSASLQAGAELDTTVVDMRFVKPLDEELIMQLAASHDLLVTIEENVIQGAAGSAVNELLSSFALHTPTLNLGIPDRFIGHDKPANMLASCGLDVEGIVRAINARVNKNQRPIASVRQ